MKYVSLLILLACTGCPTENIIGPTWAIMHPEGDFQLFWAYEDTSYSVLHIERDSLGLFGWLRVGEWVLPIHTGTALAGTPWVWLKANDLDYYYIFDLEYNISEDIISGLMHIHVIATHEEVGLFAFYAVRI